MRVDSGVGVGSEISGLYDPMIAKLIVHDTDRESARRRMLRALGEFEIGGITSLLGFHQALLGHPCFIAGETCHGLVESELLAEQASRFSQPTTGQALAANGALTERVAVAEVDGRRVEVKLLVAEPGYRELARRRRERAASGAFGAGSGVVASPMQGTVLDVKVAVGDRGRRRPGRLHRRGDEDGERSGGTVGGHRHGCRRRGGCPGDDRPADLRHRTGLTLDSWGVAQAPLPENR